MYVSIDLQKLQFVHKAAVQKVVANLAWIEMHGQAYAIDSPGARSWLGYMTDMEMVMLYRNTTGLETGYRGQYLRGILSELAERMDENEVDGFEAEVQAAQIPEGDPADYEYSFGASIPTKLEEFILQPLTADKHPEEPSIGAARHGRYNPTHNSAQHSAAAARGAATTVARSGTRGLQRPTGAPRSGGVREKIWAEADRMWEADGKPTDKSAVLALRKRIMNVLESDHGVKRTSSSNELGNWQRDRIGI